MLGEFVSAGRYAAMLNRAQQGAAHWLDFRTDEFRSNYNINSFLVHHRLFEHPQFSLAALFALCRRMPREYILHRFGVIPNDADFDSSLERFRGDLTLEDAIEQLEERQAYIVINNPEVDAEYRPIIEGLLGEIAIQTDSIEPWINWYSTYIFISARGSVTPYHMDREMNFLLQVRGTKTARLWNPSDDAVMSPAERDKLLSFTGEARPAYHPDLEAKATIFELRPGLGVHHPFIAPHLVRTGPEVSISLAITFRTVQSDRWTSAHRLNHALRGLGLNPRAVRTNRLVDRTKADLLQLVRRTRRVIGHKGPSEVGRPSLGA
jgi:hypothetical protein